MALFKINRGKDADLPEVKHDGWAYFCTDSGAFYIDYADENGDLFRKRINPEYNFSQAQSDWAETNSNLVSYIKNKPDIDKIELDIEELKLALDGKVNKEGDSLINGTLSINGDLHVKGTTYTVDAETLTVKDNLIMIQGQNQAMAGVITDNGKLGATLIKDNIFEFNNNVHINEIYQVLAPLANGNPVYGFDGIPDEVILKFPVIINNKEFNYIDIWMMSSTISFYENAVYDESLGYMTVEGDSLNICDIGQFINNVPIKVRESTFIAPELATFLKNGSNIVLGEQYISMASPVLVGDTLKIGEGIATKDENGNIVSFEFNEGDAQSIATREDNLPNETLLYWNSSKNTLSSLKNVKVIGPESDFPVLDISDKDYKNVVELWQGTAWFKDEDTNSLSITANGFSYQPLSVSAPHEIFNFPRMENLVGDAGNNYNFTLLSKDDSVQDGDILAWSEEDGIVKSQEFKTVNGVSLIGGGDITIAADGQILPMDTNLSLTSENTIQNKAIAFELFKNENQLKYSENITEVGALVPGTINTTTGADQGNTNRVRTGFIEVTSKDLYLINRSEYLAQIYSYSTNSADGFISYIVAAGGDIKIPADAAFIRIVFRKVTESTFTADNITEVQLNAFLQVVEEIPNRINTTFVKGYINATTGAEVANYARLRSDYILSNENLRIVNRTDLILMMIIFYDFGKNIIHYTENIENIEKNIQHNGYVRFILKKADGSVFTDNEINEAYNNFVILNEENTLPGYWKDYLSEKYVDIYNHGMTMGGRGDGVIFLTDMHYENNNLMSPLLIKEIQKNTNINKLVLGGDIFNQDVNKTKAVGRLRSFTSLFGKTPYALAIGNHDTNTSLTNRTEEATIHNDQVYDICIRQFEDKADTEGKTYFYFDNKAQKIRYFVLNSGDGWSASESTLNDYIEFSEQLAWLSEKAGELDGDWNIVVFQHIFFSAGKVSSSTETTIGTLGNQLINTLDVIHNDPTKANIFAVITGHVHRDYSTLTNSGYYCISTTCDAGGSSSDDYDPDYPTRTAGTTEEQAFDVFQFDIKNNAIYATRIGAGESREWHY